MSSGSTRSFLQQRFWPPANFTKVKGMFLEELNRRRQRTGGRLYARPDSMELTWLVNRDHSLVLPPAFIFQTRRR